MIVDAKVDYKQKKLILIRDDGSFEEKDTVYPYFYAIIPREKQGILERLVGAESAWVEPDPRIPIVLKGERYEPDSTYSVYRVYTESPTAVPKIASALRNLKVKIAASNLRYTIRNTFDLDVRFFDGIPLYYGFDSQLIAKLKNVKILVIDVEAIGGKPVLASLYIHRPFSEVHKDNVISLWLPEETSKLAKYLSDAAIIAGHNVLGFDIPVLRRAGISIDLLTKSVFDTSVLLVTYGSSLGVGSARSLLDVASVLRDEARITKEELEIKRNAKGNIAKLSKDELVKYNVNDVVLTVKLLDIFYPFAAVISALTQIPISEVLTLPAGMISEYFLLHFLELLGFIPEYNPTSIRLAGERVWLEAGSKEFRNVLQTDIKMMYPSFVLAHFIDPTLHIKEREFSRDTGIGVLYSAVKRLATVRKLTKDLKKSDPLFEAMDKGVKAILNALAYGVQGKQSGLAIMGNPWCPSTIFYGTMEAQYKTIDFLRSRKYQVIYSDTDSFFISLDDCKDDKECQEKAAAVVKELNEFLAKFGLEADVENIWDKMYIYGKKNYILKKGDIVIVKGSALINLDKFYTPEALSIQELLRFESKEERERYVKETIMNAPLEDLFVRGHNQIWRLISKDIQSVKRLKEAQDRYIRVLTPWNEKPTLILKKARGAQLLMPHSIPIVSLFLDGRQEIEIAELNPFNIIELRSLRLDGELSRIRAKYMVLDALVYYDRLYTVRIKDIRYGIRQRSEIKYFPMWYNGTYPLHPIGVLETLKGDIELRPIQIDEKMLRTAVLLETLKTLRSYGLL